MRGSTARSFHRSLLRAALAGGQVFGWLIVFQYFYVRTGAIATGLAATLLTYALAQVATILMTPFAGLRLRFGVRRMLVYATLALAAAFAVLAASFAGYLGGIGWGVGFFAALMGAYRGLYFTPYAVLNEGKGAPGVIAEALIALIPLACGVMLTTPIAFVALFSLASFCALLSLIPLLSLPEQYEGYSWSYRATFHELFAPGRGKRFIDTLLMGVEGAALLLLWPLLIFMLLNWSYLALGAVLSATFILSIVLRLIFDKPVSRLSAPTSALINASAWIMRLTVAGAVGVVLVDTYFNLGSRPRLRAFDMPVFEQTADNTTYVDEHTALKEIGLAMGRLIIATLGALLLVFVSVPMLFLIVFALAALAAGSSVYLSK